MRIGISSGQPLDSSLSNPKSKSITSVPPSYAERVNQATLRAVEQVDRPRKGISPGLAKGFTLAAEVVAGVARSTLKALPLHGVRPMSPPTSETLQNPPSDAKNAVKRQGGGEQGTLGIGQHFQFAAAKQTAHQVSGVLQTEGRPLMALSEVATNTFLIGRAAKSVAHSMKLPHGKLGLKAPASQPEVGQQRVDLSIDPSVTQTLNSRVISGGRSPAWRTKLQQTGQTIKNSFSNMANPFSSPKTAAAAQPPYSTASSALFIQQQPREVGLASAPSAELPLSTPSLSSFKVATPLAQSKLISLPTPVSPDLGFSSAALKQKIHIPEPDSANQIQKYIRGRGVVASLHSRRKPPENPPQSAEAVLALPVRGTASPQTTLTARHLEQQFALPASLDTTRKTMSNPPLTPADQPIPPTPSHSTSHSTSQSLKVASPEEDSPIVKGINWLNENVYKKQGRNMTYVKPESNSPRPPADQPKPRIPSHSPSKPLEAGWPEDGISMTERINWLKENVYIKQRMYQGPLLPDAQWIPQTPSQSLEAASPKDSSIAKDIDNL
jgi:hypothetical protein